MNRIGDYFIKARRKALMAEFLKSTEPFLQSRAGIRDRYGNTIPVPEHIRKKIIKAETALQTTIILQEAIKTGTGRKADGIAQSAGKTGTTDNNRDAWFIGYTPKITTGVWIGHDRAESLGREATGGEVAAPIWHDFMQAITSS